MKAFRIEMGAKVRDKVTGFEGHVTGRSDYISGCDVYMVQPALDKDDKFVESQWFDDLRLVVVGSRKLSIDERVEKTGADGEAPRK